MIVFTVSVAAVDGVRSYTLSTEESYEVRQWLEHYDHEGASVTLLVKSTHSPSAVHTKTYQGEDVYKALADMKRLG